MKDGLGVSGSYPVPQTVQRNTVSGEGVRVRTVEARYLVWREGGQSANR